MASFRELVERRAADIRAYGLAPPKATTSADELAAIAARQVERLAPLELDALVVYDIQDESQRTAEPRPFPFLSTFDPARYANELLADLPLAKIVYRSVSRDTPESLAGWLCHGAARPAHAVLVGAPSKRVGGLSLNDAYAVVASAAPTLCLGGIAIAERHARRLDEHERMRAKVEQGCRFFVTQAVYDVTSTLSLISDYALDVQARGAEPVPLLLTFSPCGSEKTLAFMKWLGIVFPRWLENELRTARDPLMTSLKLCERVFAEARDYAREKGVPLGVNVESISIRKAEVEASIELAHALRRRMG